jgi:hypothetical protein
LGGPRPFQDTPDQHAQSHVGQAVLFDINGMGLLIYSELQNGGRSSQTMFDERGTATADHLPDRYQLSKDSLVMVPSDGNTTPSLKANGTARWLQRRGRHLWTNLDHYSDLDGKRQIQSSTVIVHLQRG